MFIRIPLIILLMGVLIDFKVLAQIEWSEVFEESEFGETNKLLSVDGGDVIVVGEISEIADHYRDGWIARYSEDGTLRWSTQVGGIGRDKLVEVADRRDGNGFLAVGSSELGGGSASVRSAGLFVFVSEFGDVEFESSPPSALGATSFNGVRDLGNGQYLVWGSLFGSYSNSQQAYFALFDENGERVQEWAPARCTSDRPDIGVNSGAPDCQPVFEFGYDIVRIDESNDIYFYIGQRQRTLARRLVDIRCIRIKLDVVMNLERNNQIECEDEVQEENVRIIADDGSARDLPFRGDVRLRSYSKHKGFIDEVIIPTDEYDGLSNAVTLGEVGTLGVGFRINGNQVSRHNWDALLVLINAEGKEIWRSVLGGRKRDEFKDIMITEEGDVYVAGYTTRESDKFWRPWILKLSTVDLLKLTAAEPDP